MLIERLLPCLPKIVKVYILSAAFIVSPCSMRFPGTFVASDEARELQGRIEGKISMSIHSAWYKKREGAAANGHGKGLLTTSVMGVKNSVSPELLRKLEELARCAYMVWGRG